MTPWSCGFAAGTGFSSKRMRTRSEDIHLHISFHNPEMVKAMLPELAMRGVSSMRFAAILTNCQVGAGFSIGGGGNRGDLLGVALAASCKSAVVIFVVWAITDGADHVGGVAVVHVVTPQIAVGI